MVAKSDLNEALAARVLTEPARVMDEGLPPWARRSNPIVRRQLGMYWKLMPINGMQIVRFVAIQLVLIALSLFAPLLLTLLMPGATVSLVVLPMALALYVYTMTRITTIAAAAMTAERKDNALDLLRLVPHPLRDILYSKAAAAVWREVENLGMILVAFATASLPLLVIFWDQWLGTAEQPVLMRLATAAALIVSVARVPLEAGAAAMIGLAVGTVSRARVPAMTLSGLGLLAFFAAVNLPRLFPWSPPLRVLVEIVLPLAAPTLLIWLCVRFVVWQIERDR